jgi:protein gp37
VTRPFYRSGASVAVSSSFKQWGGVFKKRNGRELEGRTWDEMPDGPIPAARPAQLHLVPA